MSLLPALCAKNLSVMNARTNITNRRLLNPTAELGLLAAITLVVLGQLSGSNLAKAPSASEGNHAAVKINPLKPPAQGSIPVAFVISNGAQVIDFTGPWEVFQDVMVPGRTDHPFHLYTVSESTSPIHASGGMKIVPDYTFENAPAPKVIVIPAQSEPSEATLEWIRKSTKTSDVTMSVCTGAFVLAKTGLLSGKAATTFHGAFVSPSPMSFRILTLSAERGSSKMETLPPRADFPPASIWPSEWSSATSATRSRRRPLITWNIRDSAG